MNNKTVNFDFKNYEESINNSLKNLENNKIIERIWEKDFSVWSDKPEEVANRLAWLQSPTETLSHLDEINSFVQTVLADGYTNALLLGMGGSSLAPEVFSLSFGKKEGYLDLSVLDSTDPGSVLNFTERIDVSKTLFIVSTKSGGTIETLSFFKYFYNLCLDKLGNEETGKHFVAITDPGSKLEELAEKLNKGVIIKKGLQSGHADEGAGGGGVEASFRHILNLRGVSSMIVGTINPAHLRDNVALVDACLKV